FSREQYFKSQAQMEALWADVPSAIANTVEIARRCNLTLAMGKNYLPDFPTPILADGSKMPMDEYFRQLSFEGLEERLQLLFADAATRDAKRPEYVERLEFEIKTILNMGFPGYFLIVSDFIKWSKANGVPVGPGRGSGAGSLIAWALSITNLDPLRFGLLFERFLNPERVSMPDFDVDFCQEGRERVIAYVQEKYGGDRVAQIITFGTLQARAVLRDVGRVMQLPLGLVDRLAKMVPNNPAAPVTLAKAIEIEPRLQQAREREEGVAELLGIALQLEGLYRNASTHAAGVVIGDRPLTELVPLYRDPRSEMPATQFNMKWVESAGPVKFDFLGLKTLTVIDRAMGHLKRRGADFPLGQMPLDDRPAYELMSAGQTLGVFQMEGQGMRDILRQLRPTNLEEVSDLISLYRPGPMDSIPEYVECKGGRKPIEIVHPLTEKVLRPTFGVIVYQEQVMQIAQILAGYSLGEADLLRRAMGKKKKEEMDKQRARFLTGAAERGVDRGAATLLFDRMEKFAGYGFNKSHAMPYALIAYQTAWLKANAPVEFFAGSMSLDLSNTDKLALFYQDAKRSGVVVRAPDVNRSGADFEVADGEVLYALGAIRNVGLSAMEHLVEVREAGGRFRDLFDLLERIDPRQVGKRALENLARAGAFDSIHPNRAQILAAADDLIAYAGSVAAERASAQGSLFGGEHADAGRPRLPKTAPFVPSQQLDEELAAVGFYFSGHPLDAAADALRRKRVTLLADAISQAKAGAEAFRMAGVVRHRRERTSANGADKFAFVTLSDPTGDYEVLFPPEVLRKRRDILEPGTALVIRTRAKAGEADVRFFGDEAEPLDEALATLSTSLRIHVSPGAADPTALRQRLRPAEKGGGAIVLVAAFPGGREAELKLPGRYQLDPATRGALKTAPGVSLVEEA
ncbi:MAG: DNA polymerase III subunit alpha, partial [Caulobacteraceae bacterium]|nr:DNA polymerase III subunit alpha [Caulobacteraceae bacterium]